MNQPHANEDCMHGSIFVLLKRFVENTYSHGTWQHLLKEAEVEHSSFEITGRYPTHEIFAIVSKLAEKEERAVFEILEQFGESMVPDLMLMYKRYLEPEWRTYEMLLHTEEAMHGAVRRELGNKANPPKLLVTKKGNKQLIVDYYSKRRMAGLAMGIIKGIAKYFNESEAVDVMQLTPSDNERVQIKVDFS